MKRFFGYSSMSSSSRVSTTDSSSSNHPSTTNNKTIRVMTKDANHPPTTTATSERTSSSSMTTTNNSSVVGADTDDRTIKTTIIIHPSTTNHHYYNTTPTTTTNTKEYYCYPPPTTTIASPITSPKQRTNLRRTAMVVSLSPPELVVRRSPTTNNNDTSSSKTITSKKPTTPIITNGTSIVTTATTTTTNNNNTNRNWLSKTTATRTTLKQHQQSYKCFYCYTICKSWKHLLLFLILIVTYTIFTTIGFLLVNDATISIKNRTILRSTTTTTSALSNNNSSSSSSSSISNMISELIINSGLFLLPNPTTYYYNNEEEGTTDIVTKLRKSKYLYQQRFMKKRQQQQFQKHQQQQQQQQNQQQQPQQNQQQRQQKEIINEEDLAMKVYDYAHTIVYGNERVMKQLLVSSNAVMDAKDRYRKQQRRKRRKQQTMPEQRQQKQKPTSLYAYAFLIGGVDPYTSSSSIPEQQDELNSTTTTTTTTGTDSNITNSTTNNTTTTTIPKHHPMGYRGFLYNVLVASRILKQKYNSTNDIWLLVQMQYPNTELPLDDLLLLEQANINIWYLPPVSTETVVDMNNNNNNGTNTTTTTTNSASASFATTVFEKFRILQMIEYRRVMFLDADIMPVYNLDYLFELSDVGYTIPVPDNIEQDHPNQQSSTTTTKTVQLQPNVIIATLGEAANAGMFIFEPRPDAFHEVQQIIHRQHEYVIEKKLRYPFFDKRLGWGHSFKDEHYNDNWDAVFQQGKFWNYYASHSDQGLLYYYTKYYLQNVSIIIGDTIQNWIPNVTNFIQDDITSTKLYGVGHTLPVKNSEYNTYRDIMPYIQQRSIITDNSTSTTNDLLHIKFQCNNYNYSHPDVEYAMNQMGNDKARRYTFHCYPPYSHYVHFYGKDKPWQQDPERIDHYLRLSSQIQDEKISTINNPNVDLNTTTNMTASQSNERTNWTTMSTKNSPITIDSNTYYNDPYVVWFHTLRDIIFGDNYYSESDNSAIETKFNNTDELFKEWWNEQADQLKVSPLGYMALWTHHADKILRYHKNKTAATATTATNDKDNEKQLLSSLKQQQEVERQQQQQQDNPPDIVTLPTRPPGTRLLQITSRKEFTAQESSPNIVVFGNDRLTKKEIKFKTTRRTTMKVASEYAYAFLIGGIDPTFTKTGYRGFLYNVLVTTRILKRRYNSTKDFWLLVQMNHQPDNTTSISSTSEEKMQYQELPIEDQILLRNAGIHVWYLPPTESATFATTVFEKFRIVQMIEYKRVMFLDADIMPISSLDYLFDLTDNNVNGKSTNDALNEQNEMSLYVQLQPNLIVTTRGEGANAGLFILEPKPQAHEWIQQIIIRQHEHAIQNNLGYPFFEKKTGWGHDFFYYNDTWDAIIQQGKRWDYFAAHSDQGLLLYYTKYFEQKVSIVIGAMIVNYDRYPENFVQDNIYSTQNFGIGHTPPIPTRVYNSYRDIAPYNEFAIPLYIRDGCMNFNFTHPETSNVTNSLGIIVKRYNYMCYPPYSEYEHFYGKSKPWQKKEGYVSYLINSSSNGTHNAYDETKDSDRATNATSSYKDPYLLWFHRLRDVIRESNLIEVTDCIAGVNCTTGTPYDLVYDDVVKLDHNAQQSTIFWTWYKSQMDHLKDSPLGYMALFNQHASKVLNYHNHTTSSRRNRNSVSSSSITTTAT